MYGVICCAKFESAWKNTKQTVIRPHSCHRSLRRPRFTQNKTADAEQKVDGPESQSKTARSAKRTGKAEVKGDET